MQQAYPVQFSVDYPDRSLNRLTTAFRIFVAIPIFIVLTSVCIVVSAVSVLVAFLIGQEILSSDGFSTDLGAPNVLRALAGAALPA